jgi:hypothetical protein
MTARSLSSSTLPPWLCPGPELPRNRKAEGKRGIQPDWFTALEQGQKEQVAADEPVVRASRLHSHGSRSLGMAAEAKGTLHKPVVQASSLRSPVGRGCCRAMAQEHLRPTAPTTGTWDVRPGTSPELQASHEPRASDFGLQTSDFGLQTSDFGLRTSDFGLRTSDFRLRTSDFALRTSDFALRTSDFALRTSHFGLRTSHFALRTSLFALRTSDFRLQTSDFGLRTSDFGLRTSDFPPSDRSPPGEPEAFGPVQRATGSVTGGAGRASERPRTAWQAVLGRTTVELNA